MSRQQYLLLIALAAVMAFAIACSSSPKPTATPVPPTATPVPTATPTPVPVTTIEIDPVADPVGFLEALPAQEVSCAGDALGTKDRLVEILEAGLGNGLLTSSEADALDSCLSDETVRAIFIGQLSRESGGLSVATIVCISEKVGGMSAAALFLDEPAPDVIISSLQGIFCLNAEERTAISAGDTIYGFGAFGGIDSLECVVNGIGPTGLEDLMGVASDGAIDFAALGDMFPLMLDCGAIDDTRFEELGVSDTQVGCVLGELGEDGLAFLDPTATEPNLEDLSGLLGVLTLCEITLDDLMADSILPVNPADAMTDPTEIETPVATLEVEAPVDLIETDLPFTQEQIECLSNEVGEDQIENLLAGGADDLSLFEALATCGDSILPVDPAEIETPVATLEVEAPVDLIQADLPFTQEQIECLSNEVGEDQIENLLAGGAPDLSLFAALANCEVDLSTLLGP